jgi:hypothetical protein
MQMRNLGLPAWGIGKTCHNCDLLLVYAAKPIGLVVYARMVMRKESWMVNNDFVTFHSWEGRERGAEAGLEASDEAAFGIGQMHLVRGRAEAHRRFIPVL